MEDQDAATGDGESRSYLVHVEMHAECPIVLQAESVDDAVDEAMRMAAEGYFNDEFEPRYEVRVEGPDGSAQAWDTA
jgi:hypothetical protein